MGNQEQKFIPNLKGRSIFLKADVDENDPTLFRISMPYWIEEEEIEMVLVREIGDTNE